MKSLAVKLAVALGFVTGLGIWRLKGEVRRMNPSPRERVERSIDEVLMLSLNPVKLKDSDFDGEDEFDTSTGSVPV